MNLMPIAPVMPVHPRPLAPLDAEVTDFDLMNLMPVAPIMPVHPRPLAPLDAEVTDFDLMNLGGKPKAGKDPIYTPFILLL
jgi:hypothetical protein